MKKKLSFKYYIVLSLFFATMLTSVFSFSIYFVFAFSVASLVLLPIKKWWNGTSLLLVLFSTFYCFNQYINFGLSGGFRFMSVLIAPLAYYRFGQWVMQWLTEDRQRLNFLFISIFLCLLPMFLLTIQDIQLVGIVNRTRHLVLDVGKDDTSLAATLYGLMASTGIGFISILFAKSLKLKSKLIYGIVAIMAILTVVHLVNRTGIVLIAIIVIFSVSYTSRLNPAKLLSTLILIVLLLLIITKSGIISSDILDAYAAREANNLTSSSELGGRSFLWADAINNIVTHPFGWTRQLGYAHNLWLDLAAIGGWLAFLFFGIFTLNAIGSLIRILKQQITPFRLVLLSVFISMFGNSMVEPVIEASVLFFVLFVMIISMMHSLSIEGKYYSQGQS